MQNEQEENTELRSTLQSMTLRDLILDTPDHLVSIAKSEGISSEKIRLQMREEARGRSPLEWHELMDDLNIKTTKLLQKRVTPTSELESIDDYDSVNDRILYERLTKEWMYRLKTAQQAVHNLSIDKLRNFTLKDINDLARVAKIMPQDMRLISNERLKKLANDSIRDFYQNEAKALPLSDAVRQLWPNCDMATWASIEENHFSTSRFFSLLLIPRGEMTEEYLTANDETRNRQKATLLYTLETMQRDWNAGDHTLVDDIVALSKEVLGKDDAVIFDDLAVIIKQGREFHLQLVKPCNQYAIRVSHENKTAVQIPPGFCFRNAIKWLGCKLLGEPFKYKKLNVEKTARKQQKFEIQYKRARVKASRIKLSAKKTAMDNAANAVIVNTLDGWMKKITDANGKKHRNKIVTDGIQKKNIKVYLSKSLDEGDGAIILFDKVSKEGKVISAHTVAIVGGKPPHFFDPNFGEFKYQGDQIGHDLETFIEKIHVTENTSHLTYTIFPVKRKELIDKRGQLASEMTPMSLRESSEPPKAEHQPCKKSRQFHEEEMKNLSKTNGQQSAKRPRRR